jgi:hypothetical protein
MNPDTDLALSQKLELIIPDTKHWSKLPICFGTTRIFPLEQLSTLILSQEFCIAGCGLVLSLGPGLLLGEPTTSGVSQPY